MEHGNDFDVGAVLDHFTTEDAPFVLRRKGPGPSWSDKGFHDFF